MKCATYQMLSILGTGTFVLLVLTRAHVLLYYDAQMVLYIWAVQNENNNNNNKMSKTDYNENNMEFSGSIDHLAIQGKLLRVGTRTSRGTDGTRGWKDQQTWGSPVLCSSFRTV